MQIGATYSHLNGEEYLLVHRPALHAEVLEVIGSVDADSLRTKRSRERGMVGRMLFSPPALNQAFKLGFVKRGWQDRRIQFWVTSDERLVRGIHSLPANEQRAQIQAAGLEPIFSYNQIDFVKERVAVEVQFGKYAFVAHDLFVKHLHFYVSDAIDVGIEILPMKTMEREMSSGVPYYERDLVNVLRQGRGVPAVPLWMIGVEP